MINKVRVSVKIPTNIEYFNYLVKKDKVNSQPNLAKNQEMIASIAEFEERITTKMI